MQNFDQNGLLPPGMHEMTLEEFKREFAFSPRRQVIIKKLESYLVQCLWYKIAKELWLDGSFVEATLTPKDVDVLALLNANDLSPDVRREVEEFQRGSARQSVKVTYSVDVLFCFINDPNQRMSWRGVFGFRRDDTPKGWVRVVL